MVSREQILINGVPTRIHGSFERTVQDEAGQTVAEMEAVVIVRGRLPNKQFLQQISRESVQLDYEDGQTPVTMVTRVVNHTAVASGEGEGTVYRHDVTFRELPESYERRMAERAAAAAAKPVEAPRPSPRVAAQEPVGDISDVEIGGNSSVWAEAIMQMKGTAPRPKAPEEPLTLPEMAGIETVLLNLRVEALVQLLEATGFIPRGAVDARFRALLDERFIAEATQLVGEKIAQRVAREMGGGLRVES